MLEVLKDEEGASSKALESASGSYLARAMRSSVTLSLGSPLVGAVRILVDSALRGLWEVGLLHSSCRCLATFFGWRRAGSRGLVSVRMVTNHGSQLSWGR